MFFRVWLPIGLVLSFLLALLWSCKPEQKEESVPQQEITQSNPYIDPMSCKPCHESVVTKYLESGKGRSFYPAKQEWVIENWVTKPVYDSFSDLYYLPFQKDSSYFVLEFRLDGKDTIHSRTEKIDFFFGSGNQTRSYLFKTNDYLFEIPITWYRKKQIWELSPGYENGNNSRFERPIMAECMQCHNSGYEAKSWSLNRYSGYGHALSCGTCHSDIDKHLRELKDSSSTAQSIVKLGKIPLQAQFDVCRQCHLEGTKVRKKKAKPGDYEPGKLLSDYYEVFIPTRGETSDFGFASHAERLQQSACFKNSGVKLTCITCHDPHGQKDESLDFYNSKCKNCHQNGHEKLCSKTANMVSGNCVSCHMPVSGTTDIPHVSSTDHWIRKNPTDKKEDQSEKLVFKHFAGKELDQSDFINAKLTYAETHPDPKIFKEIVNFVNQLGVESQLKYFYLTENPWQGKLDTNLISNSKNPWTLFYWSQLKLRSNLPGGLNLLKKACELAPEMVEFRFKLGTAKMELGQEYISDFEQVISLSPYHSKSLCNLGFFHLEKKQYAEAEELFKKSLKGNPDYMLARENLARCYLEQGKFAETKTQLTQLIRKNPAETRYYQILKSLP